MLDNPRHLSIVLLFVARNLQDILNSSNRIGNTGIGTLSIDYVKNAAYSDAGTIGIPADAWRYNFRKVR